MIRAALERAWWQPRPTALAQLLRPLAWLYGRLWSMRAWAFRHGWAVVHHAPVPVVVVGNLIVGGAGKTPTVIALVTMLRAQGWTPGVISRGYRGSRGHDARAVDLDSDPADCGDEPLLIRRRTLAPVWVGRQRIAAARALCAAHPEIDVIVADDGLQHLALARDAQVAVFDERGVGNGLLLPAGPLREPWSVAPPGGTVVIYNAREATTPWPGALAGRSIAGLTPLAAWWAGERSDHASIAAHRDGGRLLAAAGIAAPERFFTMLEAEGLVIDRWPLPDHAALEPRPWPESGTKVVVTEKDAVKLRPGALDAPRIVVATLDFRIPDATLATLQAWLEPQRRR